MNFDFFKRKSKVVDVCIDGERGRVEKKHKWLIILIVAAICFLAFGNFGEKEETGVVEQNINKEEDTAQNYVQETEERLERMISTIYGVGKVNVMVVFDSGSKKVLATNKANVTENEKAEGGSSAKVSDEESVLLYGSGNEEQPYVLEEKMPVPSGVLVTATGAKNENVKLEIYEAVKALYGISGHRIKVSSASE